jgi:putative oxidoreductase
MSTVPSSGSLAHRVEVLKLSRQSLQSVTLCLLRITTAVIFSYHGSQKLLGAFGGIDTLGAPARMLSPLWIAGLIEGLGAILMAVGLFTSAVAIILFVEMAAIYYRHHARGLLPVFTGGAEVAVLCCFILLFIATADVNPWSLDWIIGRRTRGD